MGTLNIVYVTCCVLERIFRELSLKKIYINLNKIDILLLRISYRTLTLTLNKIYFDINEKDNQQEIDNMISRYQ